MAGAGKALAMSLLLLPAACSSTDSGNDSGIEVLEDIVLDEQLVETSGLYCEANQIFTINDSGNSPNLFTLDPSGRIVKSERLTRKNTDWESITADSEFFYIGDFGNNAGKRSDLAVLKVSRTDPSDITPLSVNYENYDIAKNEYYAHDYDAEAMVSQGDHLVLFSKSWLTRVVKVYYLDKDQPTPLLSPVAEVSGIPGVVTGADFDAQNNRYVIVGYTSNALGMFKPFIATLSAEFDLISTYKLTGYGQVEGLCVRENNTIWLTQESSPLSAAKLIRVKLPE